MQSSAQDPSKVPEDHDDVANTPTDVIDGSKLTELLTKHQRKYFLFALLPIVTGLIAVAIAMNTALRESRAGQAVLAARLQKISELEQTISKSNATTADLRAVVDSMQRFTNQLPCVVPIYAIKDIAESSDTLKLVNAISVAAADVPRFENLPPDDRREKLPLDCPPGDCRPDQMAALVLDGMRESLQDSLRDLPTPDILQVIEQNSVDAQLFGHPLRTGDVVLFYPDPATKNEDPPSGLLFYITSPDGCNFLYGYTPAGITVAKLDPDAPAFVHRPFKASFASPASAPASISSAANR